LEARVHVKTSNRGTVARFFPKLTVKTSIKIDILVIFIKVPHFFYVKKLVVGKYAKFDKYAKPKIFMPTTSKKCQIQKIWHKNMLVGNTAETFSTMRRLETYLISSIGNDRMTGLALLSIHKDRQIDREKILNDFVAVATSPVVLR